MDSKNEAESLKEQLIDLNQKISDVCLDEKKFENYSIEDLAAYIKENKCKKIVVMTGAGISVAAGIPDFRTPGTGLYDNLQKYDLPYPEAVFDIRYFIENPHPFYTLVKELYPDNIRPTLCHMFIKLLHDKGLLLRNFTQNIDGIELLVDLPQEKLVFAHGSFSDAHCIKCNTTYSHEYTKKIIFEDKIPKCTACPGVIKPRIVFFGESLPNRFGQLANEDLPECDLLIIMGTSLKVYPFAGLVNLVDIKCKRVLLNMKKARKILYQEHRDLTLLGDCQDSVRELCKALGWEDDLNALIEQYGQKDVKLNTSTTEKIETTIILETQTEIAANVDAGKKEDEPQGRDSKTIDSSTSPIDAKNETVSKEDNKEAKEEFHTVVETLDKSEERPPHKDSSSMDGPTESEKKNVES